MGKGDKLRVRKVDKVESGKRRQVESEKNGQGGEWENRAALELGKGRKYSVRKEITE